MRGKIWAGALASATMLLAACMPVSAPAGQMEMALPTPEAGKVTVVEVRARATAPEAPAGAAFLLVLNGTDAPVQLLSAEADVSMMVELHESIEEDGVMKMIPHPEGFTVPAGGVLELKPGGKHVMFMGLNAPLVEGESFPLTLNFDTAEPVTVEVPIMQITSEMN